MKCAFCPPNTGKIQLVVGFHVEPAFEDSFNAVDVILSTFDGTCPAPNASVTIGQPIDVDGTVTAKDPDTVNLKVDALYLKKAVPPTGPNGSIAPAGIEAKLTITDRSPLAEGFRNPGTYNSWFRPTHPGNATTGGAYGFHVYGKVHAGPNSFSCPGDTSPANARCKNRDDQYLFRLQCRGQPRSAGRLRLRGGHPAFPWRGGRRLRAE